MDLPTDVHLEEEIARGSVGRVYRASLSSGARLAAKLLPAGPHAEAALRHADLWRSLEHPGIARVVGVHALSDGGALLLIDPLTEGTLRGRLNDGPIPPAEAGALAAGLLEALAYAHARGVVHGDVKPENVLLTADGRPLLTDFGGPALSAPGDGLVPSWVDPDSGLTGPGSPGYWAPERAQQRTPNPAWDVFAAGALLFEAVTGALPAGPELPSDHGPVPAWADPLYRRACARAAQRLPDGRSALLFLRSFLAPPDAAAAAGPPTLIAPVVPGASVWIETDTGLAPVAVRGAERPLAARLTREEDGGYRVAGPAGVRAWEAYLEGFPAVTAYALPGQGGWRALAADDLVPTGLAPDDPSPIWLAKGGLHTFDRVQLRLAGAALLFERHDPVADAARAGKLRRLLDRDGSVAEAREVCGGPLLKAYERAREGDLAPRPAGAFLARPPADG